MISDPMFHILRSYATLRTPRSIQEPSVSFKPAHDFLLYHLLLNPHFQEFPPSTQYQLSFWKWAISWLEELMSGEACKILACYDELDEQIYAHHVELMQSTSSYVKNVGCARPQASYITYLWPTSRATERPVYPGYASATLLESRTTIEAGTTGFRTWSASLVLAQYILQHPGLIAGRRVLELGCGVGFLGVVAASVQLEGRDSESASLWLTDVNEPVLQRCKVNLSLPCNDSHHHSNVKTEVLDWSDAVDPSRSPSVPAFFSEALPDVILGADLVYEPSIIPMLVSVLKVALMPRVEQHEPVAYIALTVRNEDTISGFLQEAGASLAVEEVTTQLVTQNMFTQSTELGQDAAQTVKVLKIKRGPHQD
ncbi:hypothetical protein K466DRAFT_492516 [Polyporus arcularius HHB13444]|uniref:S-adenosyl-L-methionine-dependent methyltransferase n=1 Tax=Polyporus arcularius HHB13444 TaxID=1314778 RepID=A0A5C3PKS6_9APHY|nr:hypothetical protein K466DRAFT_492516 [Polyporus arcularius HHB13444]